MAPVKLTLDRRILNEVKISSWKAWNLKVSSETVTFGVKIVTLFYLHIFRFFALGGLSFSLFTDKTPPLIKMFMVCSCKINPGCFPSIVCVNRTAIGQQRNLWNLLFLCFNLHLLRFLFLFFFLSFQYSFNSIWKNTRQIEKKKRKKKEQERTRNKKGRI